MSEKTDALRKTHCRRMPTIVLYRQLLFLCLTLPIIQCRYTDEDLAIVLQRLGWTSSVAIVCAKEDAKNMHETAKKLSARGIGLAVTDMAKIDSQPRGLLHQFPILIFCHHEDIFGTFEDIITTHKLPSYNYMVITAAADEDSLFEDHFKAANNSLGFLKLDCHTGSACILFRVQTFRQQNILVQNEWKYSELGTYMKVFDLKGALLTFRTLSWAPWLTLYNCTSDDTVPECSNNDCSSSSICQAKGLLANLVSTLSRSNNFSVKYERQADGQWGIDGEERTDWNDPNANFTGVFGSTVRREHHGYELLC